MPTKPGDSERAPATIEDHALIGDCLAAGLISREGSLEWLCLPRFDSQACFAALLGGPENGRWIVRPKGGASCASRRYVADTLVLETTWETPEGRLKVTDFMPPRTTWPDVVRIAECESGRVTVETELIIRFGYGRIVPWVRRVDDRLAAIAGPDALCIQSDIPLHGEDHATLGEISLAEGERAAMVVVWHPSHEERPEACEPEALLEHAIRWWREWASKCTYEGEWREAVVRSLITLKALTYAPTGGLVAAPTTSLPEKLGGGRNWDYRHCWLRDATLTLYALVQSGFVREACEWRDWLVRAVAGDPSQVQPIYGVAGERDLPERQLDWLAGYRGCKPVRIGNAAAGQLQLDAFGEVMDALHAARSKGLAPAPHAWSILAALMTELEERWQEPDAGIWEIRAEPRHFTHSKVMCWVAFDRAVKAVENHDLEGPVERWRELRDRIHADACERGFDEELNSFVQSYGSKELDASLLVIPIVGFLPPDDPRVLGTIEAVRHRLEVEDGFVLRYRTESGVDGLPAGEGAFLLCSFWLVDNLAMSGREDEARRIFEKLLSLRNDVGLLAEEWDPHEERMLGNFPQAFSHVAIVNSARALARSTGAGPSEERGRP